MTDVEQEAADAILKICGILGNAPSLITRNAVVEALRPIAYSLELSGLDGVAIMENVADRFATFRRAITIPEGE